MRIAQEYNPYALFSVNSISDGVTGSKKNNKRIRVDLTTKIITEVSTRGKYIVSRLLSYGREKAIEDIGYWRWILCYVVVVGTF